MSYNKVILLAALSCGSIAWAMEDPFSTPTIESSEYSKLEATLARGSVSTRDRKKKNGAVEKKRVARKLLMVTPPADTSEEIPQTLAQMFAKDKERKKFDPEAYQAYFDTAVKPMAVQYLGFLDDITEIPETGLGVLAENITFVDRPAIDEQKLQSLKKTLAQNKMDTDKLLAQRDAIIAQSGWEVDALQNDWTTNSVIYPPVFLAINKQIIALQKTRKEVQNTPAMRQISRHNKDIQSQIKRMIRIENAVLEWMITIAVK